jgi:glycosyltransferase involved in cell wall biosynthesis
MSVPFRRSSEERLRVLMLLENNPYPQDGRVRMEATALAAAGYAVTVIAPTRGERRRERIEGVEVYRFRAPRPGRGPLGYVFEYLYSMARTFAISLRILVRDGFDVVHAHNPPDTFVVIALVYKLFGKRFVFDHHDLSPEMYEALAADKSKPVLRRMLLFFERASCRLADHLLAPNESYKRLDIARNGVAPERITVVRNGPDLGLVERARPDPSLRPPATAVVGYAGIIGYQDGVDYLLRALRHLVRDRRREDVLCYVVGDGNAGPQMRELAQELELVEHVRFTGWLPYEDLLRYMATADVCVSPEPSNPYTDRSTMVKIMEFMALGKPVAAFDLPEHRASADGAAAYARPNDAADLARVLDELLSDPERRTAMATAGRRRVRNTLAWSHSEPNLLQAYASLVNGAVPAQSSQWA